MSDANLTRNDVAQQLALLLDGYFDDELGLWYRVIATGNSVTVNAIAVDPDEDNYQFKFTVERHR